jgi:hypothetical protein
MRFNPQSKTTHIRLSLCRCVVTLVAVHEFVNVPALIDALSLCYPTGRAEIHARLPRPASNYL